MRGAKGGLGSFVLPVLASFRLDKVIKSQAVRNKETIYGARAMQAQMGFFSRPTSDYDVLSRRPRRSARMLERTLDRLSGRDFYYTKPAIHPGTWKVVSHGGDFKRGTYDDFGVADYTKPARKYATKVIEGVKYVALSEVKKDKRRSLSEKEYAYRHAKDREDLNRILFYERLKKRR